MTVGEELEHARQRCGLSLEDISDRTKVSVERLLSIERGDVDALLPLVYLRGFVRVYACEVGLDPDEVAGRYVAQFDDVTALDEFETESSEDAPPAVLDLAPQPKTADPVSLPPILDLTPAAPVEDRRARALAGPVEPVQPTTAEPVAGSAPRDATGSESDSSRAPVYLPAAAPGGSRPWRPAQFRAETLGAVTRDDAPRPPQLPHAGKLAAGVAAAILAGFILSAQLDEFQPGGATATGNGAVDPPDSVSDASGSNAASADASSPTPPVDDLETVPDPARADARAERPDVSRAGADLSVQPVSGNWTLVNRIDATNYAAFADLTLVYRLQLTQQGERVRGTGEKWSENGRAIPSRARTPIAMEGTLIGRRLELRFTEQGVRRTTEGTLVMQVNDDGSMRGRFVSEAAQSRGTARATRLR